MLEKMAGRRHEEEEECEDCKLQTILRVNIFCLYCVMVMGMTVSFRQSCWLMIFFQCLCA